MDEPLICVESGSDNLNALLPSWEAVMQAEDPEQPSGKGGIQGGAASGGDRVELATVCACRASDPCDRAWSRLVWLNDSDKPYALTVRDGAAVIDDAARYVFTHAYCAELATELHGKTGWPIVASGWLDHDNNVVVGVHFGVLMPDGQVLDIEGATELYTWAGRWGIDAAFRHVDAVEMSSHGIDPEECEAEMFAVAVLWQLAKVSQVGPRSIPVACGARLPENASGQALAIAAGELEVVE